MTFIKVVKNQIFKKIYLPFKPTWRSCFFLFHWHDPKWKQNHQISTCWAKIRSTRIQTCVKYRGNIIFIRRNTGVNKSDMKKLHKKRPKKVDFLDVTFNFSKKICVFPSTLCMAGELWTSRFIWHQYIRVTQFQSSAMSFVFTQYS